MEENTVWAGYRWPEIYILLRTLIRAFRASSARDLSAICSDWSHAMSRFLPREKSLLFKQVPPRGRVTSFSLFFSYALRPKILFSYSVYEP